MKVSCASEEELIQYLDGELSVNRCRELDSHLMECSLCAQQRAELQDLTASLSPAEGEFSTPDLAPSILARARKEETPTREGNVIQLDDRRRRKRLAVLSGVGLALAAAAVLLLVIAPWATDNRLAGNSSAGFSARGADAGVNSWRALWIYRRVAETRRYEEVKQTIRSDDALAFGYLEATGRYPYLMVFGVSSKGNVYWYYPAYEREGQNPQSIVIKRGRQELKAEIEHDLPVGALRMVALFSAAPLRVEVVERAVKQLRRNKRRARWRLSLPNTKLLVKELSVVGRSHR